MQRIAYLLFALPLIVVGAFIVATIGQLPADLFRTLLAGFLAAVALWIGTLYLRFRNLS